MHHKRRRPKNRRSGCLMCKAHKMNGATRKMQEDARTGRQEARARVAEREQARCEDAD